MYIAPCNFGAPLCASFRILVVDYDDEACGLKRRELCADFFGGFYTMVVVCQPQSGVVQAELNCAPKRCALSATSTRRTE